MDTQSVLSHNIELLSELTDVERKLMPKNGDALPSLPALEEAIDLIKALLFPGFFDLHGGVGTMRRYHLGVNMHRLYDILSTQIKCGLEFCRATTCSKADSESIVLRFIDALPELRRIALTDVEAMYANDPAADNRGEIIFCYPVVNAMIHYRVAHLLLKMGVPVIPRIITELAHSATGIDINPGATIGEYFSIDHGTGVVIGQTCIIGHHVTIYQGVTLGAKNFEHDDQGNPINKPRHPIIGDYVTIYSNASVLGRITVGDHAVIGGNVWVTNDVPAYGRVLQRKSKDTILHYENS